LKNKFVFILWVVFSIAFMACATPDGSTSGKETIVCLGDSLTAGTGITVTGMDNKSKAWPAVLQKKVNIPVINAGVSGDTTAQGLARVNKDVLSKNPKIVIILLGGNDHGQQIPVDTIKNNLQKIIDMVNDGNRKIYLVCSYIVYIFPVWSDKVEDMYKTLAASNNIEMIYGDIDWDSYWAVRGADGGHPGAKSNELFAEGVLKTLKPYLEANNLLKE
jgi:acyl-CoA thioesterase-1